MRQADVCPAARAALSKAAWSGAGRTAVLWDRGRGRGWGQAQDSLLLPGARGEMAEFGVSQGWCFPGALR